MEVGRQEVLDRPARPRTRAASSPAWPRAQQEKALDNAVFAASKSKLVGPVKTQFGYYVFEVTRSRRPSSSRWPGSKATIKQIAVLAEPAEGAERVRQRLSRSAGRPRPTAARATASRLQERAEEGGHADDADATGAAGQTPRDAVAARAAATERVPAGTGQRASPSTAADVRRPDVAAAVARLDELTRRLRRECPWDREQDERSIVPHTVEEAYELADAAHAGDDAKLLDELGDVLFQVHFLSLLLEERGAGDLAAVAEHVHARSSIRRHPHVFGEVEVDERGRGPAQLGRRSSAPRPGREAGIFGEVPENLPALLLRAQGPAPGRVGGLRLRSRPLRRA